MDPPLIAERLHHDGLGLPPRSGGSWPTGSAHLVRGWLNRPDDPDFFERAADVCGLYLDQPHNALVLSVDEKTAIAARSRSTPQAGCPWPDRAAEFVSVMGPPV